MGASNGSLNFVKNNVIPYTLLESNGKQSKIWSSLCCSMNYYSYAHVDEDFFLLCVSLVLDNTHNKIAENPIVQYFCFPTIGKKVEMRSGDILIFNPTVYHCCSKKHSYIENNVHIFSMYLKSKYIGKNDNNIPLNEEQSMFLK